MKVILLRSNTSKPESSALHSKASSRPSDTWSVTGEDMTPDQLAREVSRDSTLMFAPPIPLQLLKPKKITSYIDINDIPDVAWGVSAVKADKCEYNGAGIKVAILDTGIDSKHPMFAGLNIIEKDFTGEGNHDQDGHGTHCAGTLLGREITINSKKIRCGVAPGISTALIGKVIGNNTTSSLDLCKAIEWAVQEETNVISMSLGIDFAGYISQLEVAHGMSNRAAISQALADYRKTIRLFDKLFTYVQAKGKIRNGAIIISASGNESHRELCSSYRVDHGIPASATSVLSVAAVKRNSEKLEVAPFSNSGATVCAPGTDIISAKAGGGLEQMSGTSMSTPHVAGVAALWAQKEIEETTIFSAEIVVARLIGTAKFLSGSDFLDIGAGLIQAPVGKRFQYAWSK